MKADYVSNATDVYRRSGISAMNVDYTDVPDYDLQNYSYFSPEYDPTLRFYDYMERNHEPDMSSVDGVGYRPYQAIEDGSMHGLLIESTDGDIVGQNLVILDDRLDLIDDYAYFAAPMVRDELIQAYPQVEQALDRVTMNLTLENMGNLNYSFDYGGSETPYEEVIEEYVEEMPEGRQ